MSIKWKLRWVWSFIPTACSTSLFGNVFVWLWEAGNAKPTSKTELVEEYPCADFFEKLKCKSPEENGGETNGGHIECVLFFSLTVKNF